MMKAKKDAVIIVDPQQDFCPGGALVVPKGDEIFAPINKMIKDAHVAGIMVVITRDWHPVGMTGHFAGFGGQWPAHCVQGTEGAEFHPDLFLDGNAIVVDKGAEHGENAYSGFAGKAEGKTLSEILSGENVGTVYVAGLATDYCVKETVLDAVRYGFNTFLIADCCRAVNINPDDGEKAIKEMKGVGATVINSKDIVF